MSDYLPFDLVTNILLRLPVAAILRCRGVCKPWLSLIDSPRFAKLQMDYSAATTKNAALFILEDDGYENGDLHFAPYIDGIRRETCLDFRSNPSSSAQVGVKIPRECVTLFGSCNGLLCFGLGFENAIITNPATRRSHVTPAITNLLSFGSKGDCIYRYGCGFGYDSVSGDYKVVKVNQVLESAEIEISFHSELVSYGVRSNSSVSMTFPYYLASAEKLGVFVGGAIHWLVHKDPDIRNVIVGFDLGRSECREVPQPEYRHGESLSVRIGELGKCLCIFANYWDKGVDIWMMKEYGVKESWSVMLSVPHPGLCYDDGIRSLGFSRTGQEILLQLDYKRLVWYDLKKKNPQKDAAEEITIHGLEKKFMEAIVCIGSLVSPDGKFPSDEVEVDKQQQKPRLQKKEKKRDDFLSTGFKLKL
ncbi:unnamed protein product [Linum tenue]|uniref:F-box domain-containing protein n=1 Tax=Linum tenue TaxID=586396 RepID=A0AAV0GPY7_9ROSI|nr:unnamed protein product [Linum tenue]